MEGQSSLTLYAWISWSICASSTIVEVLSLLHALPMSVKIALALHATTPNMDFTVHVLHVRPTSFSTVLLCCNGTNACKSIRAVWVLEERE